MGQRSHYSLARSVFHGILLSNPFEDIITTEDLAHIVCRIIHPTMSELIAGFLWVNFDKLIPPSADIVSEKGERIMTVDVRDEKLVKWLSSFNLLPTTRPLLIKIWFEDNVKRLCSLKAVQLLEKM